MRKPMELAIAACCFILVQAHAQQDTASRARHIAELTNRDREAHGLDKLQWNDSLAAAARAHAERMAEETDLSHEYAGEGNVGQRAAQAGVHFRAIAENIATGFSDEQVEQEWMHSPPHRANILDPKLNAIGVGVVERGGTLYVTEDFAEANEALSHAQVERKVAGLLERDGVNASMPRSAAARACDRNSGYPPGGKLIMRFDTGDLSRLPEQISAQVQRAGYQKASVAACPGGRQGSFTTYKVAIVFY
jgi:hypothetical protein